MYTDGGRYHFDTKPDVQAAKTAFRNDWVLSLWREVASVHQRVASAIAIMSADVQRSRLWTAQEEQEEEVEEAAAEE